MTERIYYNENEYIQKPMEEESTTTTKTQQIIIANNTNAATGYKEIIPISSFIYGGTGTAIFTTVSNPTVILMKNMSDPGTRNTGLLWIAYITGQGNSTGYNINSGFKYWKYTFENANATYLKNIIITNETTPTFPLDTSKIIAMSNQDGNNIYFSQLVISMEEIDLSGLPDE